MLTWDPHSKRWSIRGPDGKFVDALALFAELQKRAAAMAVPEDWPERRVFDDQAEVERDVAAFRDAVTAPAPRTASKARQRAQKNARAFGLDRK